MKLDFIGIGSGKCGSTWLWENMVQHPKIFDGNPKEINYFSKDYHFERRGIDWYENHFLQSEAGLVKGEFSVIYMYDTEAHEHIRECYPDIKILAILRDPVLRTYSDYHHSLRKAEIESDLSFAEYIQREENLEYGFYYKYLKPYYENFSDSQVLVLTIEECTENPEYWFRVLFEFLGVDDKFLPDSLDKMVNKGKTYKYLWVENILTVFSRTLNNMGYTRFIEGLKRTGIQNFVRDLNTKDEKLEQIPASIDRELRDYFASSNEDLSQLVGRKLFD